MEPIHGPGGRYQLQLELFQAAGNGSFIQRPATDVHRHGNECLVLFGPDATARLTPGEEGLILHSVGLDQEGKALLQAKVAVGPEAPGGPTSATVTLFEGERQAAESVLNRFISLAGVLEPELTGALTLDQLFVAVGRSVARANRLLVGIESPGGTALVTTVTVSIAVDALTVQAGRVVVKPTGGDQLAPQVSVGTAPPMAGGQAGEGAPMAGGQQMATRGTSRPLVPAPAAPISFPPPPPQTAAQTVPQTTTSVAQVTGPNAQTGPAGVTSFVQFTLALAPGASSDP